MDGLRDQTDVEFQLLGAFDEMDGLRDQNDVELQLLGAFDDMDGLRVQTDVELQLLGVILVNLLFLLLFIYCLKSEQYNNCLI